MMRHHGGVARHTRPVAPRKRGVLDMLRSRAARPLRFACTGGVAALVQLGILDALTERRWAPIAANGMALLVSTQVNFVLSYLFTWRDRRLTDGMPLALLGRWATYQGSVAGSALLNMTVFVVARSSLHLMVASALGTIVAAVVNYIAGDRLVFRLRGRAMPNPAGPDVREHVA